jgi:hypothetical protein
MVQGIDISGQAEKLRLQMQERLGLKAKSFEQGVKRAGRRLPRRVRRAADVILAAQALGGNPKLERQVDPKAFAAACREISLHLDSVDIAKERADKRLRLLALIALQVLIVIALFVVWVWWRGNG